MTAKFRGQRPCLLAVILLVVGTGQGCAPSATRAPQPERAAGQPRVIAVGDSVTDSLAATDPSLRDRGPFRAYRFAARTGEEYAISLSSTDFDSYLSVVTHVEGVPDFIRDDDGGGGTNSLVRFQPHEPGMYVVIAQALDRKPGAFTLAIRVAPPDARPQQSDSVAGPTATSGPATAPDTPPQPVALDVATEGVLRGSPALYTFRGSAGQPYIVELGSDRFDSFLEVGTILPCRPAPCDLFTRIHSNDDGGAGLNARLIFMPVAEGEYAIRVSAMGTDQGPYTLRVGRAPSAVAGLIRLDSLVRGHITTADSPVGEGQRPADDWLFTADAGRRYAATMSAGDSARQLDTYVSVGRIRNRGFSRIAANDDATGLARRTDSRVVFTAAESGEYVIRAMPWDADSTGAYELRVDELPRQRPAPERRRAVLGQDQAGMLDNRDFELTDGSRVDEWIISATRTDTLVVTLASTDFDAFLSVGAAVDGQFVAYSSNDDAAPPSTDARVVMIPPSSGEYVIRAISISPTATGRYTLRVEKR